MQPEDYARLRHMIEAANVTSNFVKDRARRDLDTDTMLLFALVRAVEVFGEAAAKISSPLKEANPNLPWQQIVAMRNRLIHAYFDIDRDILWNTVKLEIPKLLHELKHLVGQ